MTGLVPVIHVFPVVDTAASKTWVAEPNPGGKHSEQLHRLSKPSIKPA